MTIKWNIKSIQIELFADAAVRKLFPDGHLVVPGVGSDNAKKQ
ncbi:MAG: hypothetical protein ACJ72T_11570 [Nitrososphaeraceae archaeon]